MSEPCAAKAVQKLPVNGFATDMTETQISALKTLASANGSAPAYRLSDVQIRACISEGLVLRTRHGLQLTCKGRELLAETVGSEQAA